MRCSRRCDTAAAPPQVRGEMSIMRLDSLIDQDVQVGAPDGVCVFVRVSGCAYLCEPYLCEPYATVCVTLRAYALQKPPTLLPSARSSPVA